MAKVLIADDDEMIHEPLSMLLRRLGFDSVVVSEAHEIADAARRERPEILLQDARMPGLLDLATHIRALRADPQLLGLKVILFTGNPDAEYVWQNIGADGVLEKPFAPADLRRVLLGA